MHITVTRPLFASETLEDSPSLSTIQQVLASIPDAPLWEGLRAYRDRGRNDYPVHVLWAAFPDRTNGLPNDGKLQSFLRNHPGRVRHNLFAGQNAPADHFPNRAWVHLQLLGCLRQSQPSPWFLMIVSRYFIIGSQSPHPGFGPTVAGARTTTQSVQNRRDRDVRTHLGQLTDQIDHLAVHGVTMLAGAILGNDQTGMAIMRRYEKN
jgi:hypothetical protein